MVRRVWNNGAEGGTPLSANALNSLEDDVEEALELGGSYQLNVGTVTTGVAGASLGPKLPDNSQNLNLTLPTEDTYGWIAACFLANGAAGEKLSLFYSPDGKTLFGGQSNPVYGADSVRDPSIIYWQDKFFVCYTLADGVGRNFKIVSSPTGAAGSWSTVATVSVSGLVAAGDKCWAPEFVIDGANVHVFFSWQKATTSPGNSSMGYVTATNTATLASWSAPTALSTSGFPVHYIDGAPIQHGSNWYLFASIGNDIIRGMSTTGVTGTYTLDRTGNWAGWGTGIEGPYITKVKGTYRIYFDRFVAGTGVHWSESSDLNTWSTPVSLNIAPYVLPPGTEVRHGSFLQLPSMQAGVKAQAATMGPQGVWSAAWTQGPKSIPNGAVTNMGAIGTLSDPMGVIRAGDASGGFRASHGGLYLVTVDVEITTASGTSARVFVDLTDGGSIRLARFAMGGEGEDKFTGTAQIGVNQDQYLQLNVYHLQGSAKTFTVRPRFTRLGGS